MTIRLFVVHNSHPCTAVEKALELKGLAYKTVEWPPPMHAAMQLAIFGSRTVPGLIIDGEKVQGSRRIFHRLDEIVPEPMLYPANPAQRSAVESADRWGDEVFQQVARDLLWVAIANHPEALVSLSRGSHLSIPAPVVKLIAPSIAEMERRLNGTSHKKAAWRLHDLPRQIAKIDAWIAHGTMGDPAHPNAADLQILSTVRLLNSLSDVRPLLHDSPATALAERLFGGPVPADVPGATVARD